MQTRRDFLQAMAAAPMGLGLLNPFWAQAAETVAPSEGAIDPRRRPNILLITADDLGPQLGCYGDKRARTPHLDRLAAEGVRFTTAWVTQASCSPSRSSIHTGLYPHQNGLIGLCHRGYSMHREYPTLSRVLRQAGYRTGVIGKFHIEPKSAAPWDMMFVDADVCIHGRGVVEMAEWADELFEFDDKPFFLMANYIDPHRPFYDQKDGLPAELRKPEETEPFDFLGMDTPEIREDMAGYYNCVDRLDSGVGMLMDLLDKHGKADNTMVIFVGDHGPPFTRAKCTCYEAAMAVPFLVKWPGVTPKGMVRDEMVSTVDIMATVYDMLGVHPEVQPAGMSLTGLLQGKTQPWRKYLFGEYGAHQQAAYYPRRTVRDDRYHLILNLLVDEDGSGKAFPLKGVDGCAAWGCSRDKAYAGTKIRQAYDRYRQPPRVELYDLQADPNEFVNLADDPEHQAVKQRLLSALQQWREETGDPLLEEIRLAQEVGYHAIPKEAQ